MTSVYQDVRFAFRGLIKNPGFAVVAVLILALGFGANSTMFTVVNSLFFEPTPGIRAADEIVRVNRSNESTRSGSLSYPDFTFYRDNNDVFDGFTGYSSGLTLLTAELDGRLIPVDAQLVAGNFFDVLGVTFARGRGFLSEEDRVPDEAAVAVVSHAFWERELRRTAIGQTVLLNGNPFVLVGVVGPEFRQVGPTEGMPDVWLPLMMRSMVFRSAVDWVQRVPDEFDLWIEGFGRLAPGVTVDRAQADMSRLAAQLEDTYPSWNAGQGIAVHADFQYNPGIRDRLATIARLLVAVAAVVLLIACANVAILMLTRASARRREFGVRVALGASRARLIRQLLVESSVLAGVGATLGLLIATWTSDIAGAMIPLSVNVSFEPDATVIAWTLGAAVVATLLFGLTPAWFASRPDVVASIKGALTVRRRSLVRHTLVVSQVALAILLVTGAGLFVQSLRSAQSVDPGFATEDRVSLRVNLRNHGYSIEEGRAFVRDALDQLAAMAGVTSATSTTRFPLTRGSWGGSFQVPGIEPPDGQAAWDAGMAAVGPHYFATLGIPMVRGRDYAVTDDERAPLSIIVNELLARQVWGDEDPIGRTVFRGTDEYTVIGVARQSMYYTLGEDPTTQLYFAELQNYQASVTFVLHAAQNPAGLIQPARDVLQGIDPTLAVSNPQTVEQLVRSVTQRYRVNASVLSLFGLLALLLAALGLYGVLAYTVAQQTHDIGIRMALGARRGQLARSIIGLGLRLALVGVAIGGAIAWWLSESITSLLFEITPRDPLTFSLVPFVLIGVAMVASYLPARRASYIDPMEALRFQ